MLLQQIILLLTAHKHLFLFPVAVVEGPIITVIAGFLSSLGLLNIFIAYAVVVVGDIVGDIMHYAFGYYGGQRFVKRWGRFLGITLERVEQLQKHFEKHCGKTLIIGKLSQGCRCGCSSGSWDSQGAIPKIRLVQFYCYPAEISNTFTHWLLFWRKLCQN